MTMPDVVLGSSKSSARLMACSSSSSCAACASSSCCADTPSPARQLSYQVGLYHGLNVNST